MVTWCREQASRRFGSSSHSRRPRRAGQPALLAALAQLPCTQGLLAVCLRIRCLAFGQGSSAGFPGSARRARGAALHTWHYCGPNPPPYTGSLAASTTKGLTFRASAVRDGKHIQLAAAGAGSGCCRAQTHGLGVNLRKFDLEVIAIMLQASSWWASAWAWRPSNGRLGGEPAPLLPHIDCTALAPIDNVADAATRGRARRRRRPDPMCGIGTLPVVAAASCPCVAALAGDVDERAWQAAQNAHVFDEARRRARRRGAAPGLRPPRIGPCRGLGRARRGAMAAAVGADMTLPQPQPQTQTLTQDRWQRASRLCPLATRACGTDVEARSRARRTTLGVAVLVVER